MLAKMFSKILVILKPLCGEIVWAVTLGLLGTHFIFLEIKEHIQ